MGERDCKRQKRNSYWKKIKNQAAPDGCFNEQGQTGPGSDVRMVKKVLIGLVLIAWTLSVNAIGENENFQTSEMIVELKNGTPTNKVFLLAAKKAFLKLSYTYTVIDDNKVTDVYRRRVSMDMILKGNTIIVRNTDPGTHGEGKIKSYLKTLSRDIKYELAEFTL